MNIGVLGSGDVARTLAAGFVNKGHATMLGSRDPAKLADWAKANPDGRVGKFDEAAKFGEVVVLAVKGSAASEVLRLAGADNLAGKPVIDACNPFADKAPVNGVISFFTTFDRSLMEQLQADFPGAHLVKAFNSVGVAMMVDPSFPGVKPTMFICGNDEAAKKTAGGIVEQLGWEVADMGAMEAARAIEPLAILWCIPGFARGEWAGHAFKLLRQ